MTVSEPFMTCHKSPAYSMFPLAWNDWQNNVMGFLKAAVCDGPVGVATRPSPNATMGSLQLGAVKNRSQTACTPGSRHLDYANLNR